MVPGYYASRSVLLNLPLFLRVLGRSTMCSICARINSFFLIPPTLFSTERFGNALVLCSVVVFVDPWVDLTGRLFI